MHPAEDPHEEELHHVGVDEEELRAAVTLGAGDGVPIRGVFGQEDIFKGAKLRLWGPRVSSSAGYAREEPAGRERTRKKALARKQ